MSLRTTLRKALAFTALLTGLSLGVQAQSNHTVTFTGNASDFNVAEKFSAAANSTDYYITFDANNMYFAAFRTGGNTFGTGDNFAIYMDTDPRSTPTTAGNGSTTGRIYNGVTPSTPFKADYAQYIAADNTTDALYSNNNTSWSATSYTPGNNSGMTFTSSTCREIAIPLSKLGGPASMYVSVFMGYAGGIFSSAPGTDVAASATPALTGYFGSFAVYKSGVTPISAVNTAISNLAVSSNTTVSGDYGDITVTGAFTWTLAANSSFSGSLTVGSGTTNASKVDFAGKTLYAGGRGPGATAGLVSLNGSSGTVFQSSSAGSNLIFLGNGSINGANTTKLMPSGLTIQLYGGVDFFASGTIATTFASGSALQINNGGFVNTNAAVLNTGSTLIYNSGTTYTSGSEWTTGATSGAGIPDKVTINAGTTLSFGSSAASRYLSGDMSILGGLTLSSATGGDIRFAGNFTNSGTFNTNGRALIWQGTGTKIYTKTGGGTESLDFLIVNSASQLTVAPGTNFNLTSTNATGCLQFNAAGTVFLNGASGNTNTITIPSGGTIGGTSGGTIGGNSGFSFLNFAGSATVNPGAAMTTSSNVIATINGGVSITTASRWTAGYVQINTGGFISTNPIVYSSGTLVYNASSTYGVNSNEWPAASGPANVTIQNAGASFGNNNIGARTISGTLTLNADLSLSGSGTPSLTVTTALTANSTAAITGSGAVTTGISCTFTTANSAGVNGTLTTSGTKTIGTSNSFVFNGSAAQVTGILMPTSISALTINNAAGVTISNNTLTLSSTTTLTSGALVLPTAGGNLVTFAGFSIPTGGGSLTGSATSNITTTVSSGLSGTSAVLTFTGGAGSQVNNWSVSNSFGSSSTVGLGSVVTVNGTFTMTGLPDFYTTAAGGLILANGSTYTDGGASNNRVLGAGSFNLQSGATLITGHTEGLTASSTTTGMVRSSGTRTFSGSANYTFSNSSAQVTGDAIDGAGGTGKTGPITGTLTITGANVCTLTASVIVNSPGLFRVGTGSSPATLVAGTNTITGTGAFSLLGNGATVGSSIQTAHASGLNGTVAVSGTIDMANAGNNNTNFTFNGSAAQVTGALLPAIVNNLTNSNTSSSTAGSPGLTFSNTCTVNGTLTVGAQFLSIGNNNTLTVAGGLTIGTAQRLVAGTNSNFVVNGSGTITSSTSLFASGGVSLNNLTMNRTGSTLNVGTPLTVSGTYSSTAGVVNMSSNTITLNGPIAFGSGTLTATGPLAIGGSGTITGSLTGTSNPLALSQLTLNRSGATLTLGTAVTVSNAAGALALNAGVLNIGSNNLTLTNTAGTITTTGTLGTTTMIQADGAGYLGKTITGTTPSFAFPIGSSGAYSPVTLSFTANGNSAGSSIIYAKVTGSAHGSMNSGSTPAAYLARYWTLNNSGLTTYTYDAVYGYQDGDVNGTEASLKLSRWSGTAWTEFTTTVDATNNTLTASGLGNSAAPISSANDYTGRANPSAVSYVWNGSVSNDWATAANWTPNGVPTALDDVTIATNSSNNCVINTGTNASVLNLTVNATGVLNAAASSSLTIAGTSTYTTGSGALISLDCASTVNYNSASAQNILALNYGALNLSGGNRTFASGATTGICGALTTGAGTHTLSGSTINYNGSGAQTVVAGLSYNNLTISNSRGNAAITLGSGTISVAGALSVTATNATYTNTGNTIDFNGTGAQTVAAFSGYNNLTISGARASATVTLASGTIGIAGTFNPSATSVSYSNTGNTFDYTSSSAQTIYGPFTYNNLSNSGGGNRTLTSAVITIGGSYSPTVGTVTIGTSTIDFASASTQTIPTSSYYNITNTGNGARTLASSGANSNIININAGFSPGSGLYTIDGSTVQYSSSASTTWTLSNFSVATTGANPLGRQYHNVIFGGSLNTFWQLGSGVNIATVNDFTYSGSGSFYVANNAGIANTITVGGAFSMPSGGGVFVVNKNTGTGTLTVAGNATISSGSMIVSNAAGTGNLTVTGTLTNGGGGFTGASTGVANVSLGALSSSASLTASSTTGSHTFNITGNATVTGGTFIIANAGTVTSSIGGNLSVSGSGSFNIAGTSGSCSLSVGGTLSTSATNFRVSNGSGSGALTVTGDATISGGTFSVLSNSSAPTTTVNFNGALTISGAAIMNLETTSSTNGVANVNIQGLFSMTSTSAQTVDFGTGTTAGNNVTLYGNFNKSGTGSTQTAGTNTNNGFVFAKSGTQTFSWTSSTPDWTTFTVNSGSTLQLQADFALGVATSSPIPTFTVNGTLDAQTFKISGMPASASASFNLNGTLKTANTVGVNDGTSNSTLGGLTAATLVKNYAATANYEFNGASAQATNLPAAAQTMNNLTINNAAGVSLNTAATVNGNLVLTAGTMAIGSNTLTLKGNVTRTAGAVNAASGTVAFNGVAAQSIAASAFGNNSISTLTINNAAGVSTSDNLTAASTNLTAGVFQIGSTTFTATGSIARSSGTMNAQTGTLVFAGSSQQTTPASAFTNSSFGALTINNASGVVLGENSSVAGDLVLTAGTFDLGSRTINVAGNVTRSGGSMNASAATLVCNGSTAQTIAANSFNGNAANLTINNSQGVTLNSALTLTGSLALTAGKLDIGNNLLTVPVAGIPAGSGTAYIKTSGASGAVLVTGITSAGKTIPVGNATFNPVTIAGAATQNWSVRIEDAVTNISPSLAANANKAVTRMWHMTPSLGSPLAQAATLTFQYSDATDVGASFNQNTAVKVWHYNGTKWLAVSAPATPSGTPGGTRTVTAAGLTQFSPYAISNIDAPLPVSLLSFTGKRNGSVNELKWKTASESNNRGFAIERSADGASFTQVGFVTSRASGGNSSSDISYSYNETLTAGTKWYYRLKQVDFDGQYKYSAVVLLKGDKSGAISVEGIYPNPVKASTSIRLQAGQTGGTVALQLTDMLGKVVRTTRINTEAGAATTVSMDLTGLAAGQYHLKAIAGSEVSEAVTVVKQ